MRWILGVAVAALMFGAQAKAATIGGLDEVVLGQVYKLTFDTGPIGLDPNTDHYVLDLKLPTKKLSFSGSVFPQSNQFQFDWVFMTAGETTLDVSASLRSYVGTDYRPISQYSSDLIPVNLHLAPMTSHAFSASRTFQVVSERTVAVMPIGGTLPLMLSALGLMGWAARRRGKRGALSA